VWDGMRWVGRGSSEWRWRRRLRCSIALFLSFERVSPWFPSRLSAQNTLLIAHADGLWPSQLGNLTESQWWPWSQLMGHRSGHGAAGQSKAIHISSHRCRSFPRKTCSSTFHPPPRHCNLSLNESSSFPLKLILLAISAPTPSRTTHPMHPPTNPISPPNPNDPNVTT
jgi:hypothetical protein